MEGLQHAYQQSFKPYPPEHPAYLPRNPKYDEHRTIGEAYSTVRFVLQCSRMKLVSYSCVDPEDLRHI